MSIVDIEEKLKMKRNGICPFCNEKVDTNEFRDGLSEKEFMLSGLCQKCQDKFFE